MHNEVVNQSPPTGENPKRIAVIIVHYRTPALLEDCLASLADEIDPQRDYVLVIDNASGKEAVEAVREMIERRKSWAKLIESPLNLGFAGANDLGIGMVEAEYYLLLNPDTVVQKGAIVRLHRFLEEHEDAAMVGPRLEYPDGRPQLSSFGDPTPLGELIRGANIGLLTKLLKAWEVYGRIPETTVQVDWVAGACLLIRAEVLHTVGMLDRRYFMYYEEVDFCRRARLAGHACWYLPEAHVVHLVGQSSGVTNQWEQRRLPRYWFESRHRYFRRHFGYLGILSADLLWLTGHALMRIRKAFTGISHSPCARGEVHDFIVEEARQLLGKGQDSTPLAS